MNNKGFTLIELVACVVILACIALFTTTSLTTSVKKSRTQLYDTQINLIKEGAINYVNENIDKAPSLSVDNDSLDYYVNLSELQESGLLDKNINNPITNEDFEDGDLCILIKLTYSTTYEKTLFDYEVSDDVSKCVGVLHFGE